MPVGMVPSQVILFVAHAGSGGRAGAVPPTCTNPGVQMTS